MYQLYLITNHVNGKVYIGQTSKTAEERWKMHCWTVNKPDYFHRAIKKHGPEAFEVQTIAIAQTVEEISQLEIKWIAAFRSHEKMFGYNTTLGGEYGAVPNEEVRAKIGAASSSRTHDEKTREKMRLSHLGENNHFFGKSHTEETIEKIRRTCKEVGGGEKAYWYGKTLSASHKANLSKVRKGRKPKPKTEEGRRILSEKMKAYWAAKREQKMALDSSPNL